MKNNNDTIADAIELVKIGVLKIMPNGDIIRCKRRKTGKNDGTWYPCTHHPAGTVTKYGRGYFEFPFKNSSGIKRSVRLHRLVYSYFYGDIPDGYEIHHKDNNKLNNHPSNLVLVTHLQNMRMATNDGLYKSVVGSNNPCARIDESTVLEICKLISKNKTARSVAKQLGISVHIIYNLVHGKTWQHLDCVRNIKYLGRFYKR